MIWILVFIAVGTPSDETGNADLSAVFEVAETIADYLSRYVLIVTKARSR